MSEKIRPKNEIRKRRELRLRDKKLKYFMENRQGEFRMRVIDTKRHEPKVTPHNIDKFLED